MNFLINLFLFSESLHGLLLIKLLLALLSAISISYHKRGNNNGNEGTSNDEDDGAERTIRLFVNNGDDV